jgi:small subunit ribosomal protein S1
LKTLKIGQEVTGTVAKVTEFGLFVKLPSGIDGLIRSSEIALERSIFSERPDRSDRSAARTPVEAHTFKEGDSVTASVLKINKKDRKLELSIRRYEKDQEKELLRKYSGNTHQPTLGETTGWEDGKGS